jgi:hypothetical protein
VARCQERLAGASTIAHPTGFPVRCAAH